MGLFDSIEIDSRLIPYITKGEGVGIVKIDGLGKCSARLESNEIVLTPYEGQRPVSVKLPSINLLSYDKGNFINEPKMTVGVSGRQYVLAGVNNNDDELERFYNTILDLKDREQRSKQGKPQGNPNNSRNGMPHPNPNITNPNKQPNKQPVNNQDIDYEPQQQDTYESEDNFTTHEPVHENISQKDPVDEIRRYYELKEDGIISEDEFNQKKKQLLGL
ncbi:SHOCT domain-containing protein [Methanosphaera sp.]